jgi:hypothetical protein
MIPIMSDERTNDDMDTVPEDGMRKVPTDPPEVVPAISSEQLGVAAGLGLSGFAQQNPEGGFVGDEDEAWASSEATPEEGGSQGDETP